MSQSIKRHSVQQICEQFSEMIVSARNTDCEFSSVDAAGTHNKESLIFASDVAQLPSSDSPLPAVIVTDEVIAAELVDNALCVIVVKDVRLAQAQIKQKYSDYDSSDTEWSDIHPSAVIHESVELGDNVRVGPNTVLGRDVVVAKNTQIRANCVIEHSARIGEDCIINNLVNIGYSSQIGNRVIIHSGVIIGNEGFGLAQDQQRRYHRVPHTGIVEIHDDVQIGSNSNVDRGTYGKTVISRGVKIDSLCQIAHNCFIDEDTLFVAQSGAAGSSKIGKRVIASGQTGILDHRTVVDDVILVHRSGVIEDITSPGVWAGTPPKPFKEYVRDLNLYKKVEKLKQRLDKLTSDKD